MHKQPHELGQHDASDTETLKSSDLNTTATYGLKALATVVFDIDSGQKLDSLYPPTCGLSAAATTSIAHLALPHSNNQDEGDTQFTVRFREAPQSQKFLYGFVLFRQQKDESRNRGYFQKALMIISEKPYIDLYDRVLRVIGPLYFQAGKQVLEAVYTNIRNWPAIVLGSPVALPLAGTYISCIIPELIDYAAVDGLHETETSALSPSDGHLITDDDEEEEDERSIATEHADSSDNEGEGGDDDGEAGVFVNDGSFFVTRNTTPPTPSFGDLLISKRTRPTTAFESIGLYTSFIGVEKSLWMLWQLAITGESFLILSPHARTCSQATLAFSSLISPLKFQGDCRPYYTIYEADFDDISRRQNHGVSDRKAMTVIGTTNPFLLKSFKRWPSALIFSFLEDTEPTDSKAGSSKGTMRGNNDGYKAIRIKKNVDLDDFESSDHTLLLRRCPTCVVPDATVLGQLVAPRKVYVTQTASLEEEPFAAINNTILRRHFRKLTKGFLRPFEQYFGIWKSNGVPAHLYMSAKDYMKPFNAKTFLRSIDPRALPPQIKRKKWKALYMGFIQSPHFEPWFNYRRERCVQHFANTLRALRELISPEQLLSSQFGSDLSFDQCQQLQKEMELALEMEQNRTSVDMEQIRVIETHLAVVKNRIEAQTRGR